MLVDEQILGIPLKERWPLRTSEPGPSPGVLHLSWLLMVFAVVRGGGGVARTTGTPPRSGPSPATAQIADLNIITYLTAYLDECDRIDGKSLAGLVLERLLP
jgi:hypothetical protein